MGKTRKNKKSKTRNKKTKKNKKLLKINKLVSKLNGGGNLHYIISCHASSENIKTFTDIYNKMLIYSYTEDYGFGLNIKCAYDLQTYLTNYRDEQENFPKCFQKKSPWIDSSIIDLHLYVTEYDTWNSGILDVTSIGNPRIVQQWTYEDSNYYKGYNLNTALNDIYIDASKKYSGLNTIKVHLLTCL